MSIATPAAGSAGGGDAIRLGSGEGGAGGGESTALARFATAANKQSVGGAAVSVIGAAAATAVPASAAAAERSDLAHTGTGRDTPANLLTLHVLIVAKVFAFLDHAPCFVVLGRER